MALSKKSVDEIPKDAVMLTEEEALRYQWKIIKDWEKPGEVWALRHTTTIGALMSSLTGIFVNSHFRRKLRLGSIGHMTTYLPIVVIPALFSLLTHKFFVQRDVILDPMKHCPMCLQFRAAAFQTGCGVVYPTILAPLAACMYASRHFTYRLPSITENPKEAFQLLRKFGKPIVPALGVIFGCQAITTMFLTYKEIEQSVNLLKTMRKIEEKLNEEMTQSKLQYVQF